MKERKSEDRNSVPDRLSPEEGLVALLKDGHLTVTAAESCTGGLLASRLTSVSGASNVFPGSAVTYSVPIKESLIGVPDSVIQKDGVVSTACAREMAKGVRKLFHTDLAVGITGWAGPYDGDDGQPAGTVCIAIDAQGMEGESVSYHFEGDRNTVRTEAVNTALSRLTCFAEMLCRIRQKND
ncbi:MAG: CinA family protein [Eubacteriales bacterium]